MKNFKSLISILFIAGAGIASAQDFNLSDIINWTGSGSNEAALVIDWQDGSAHPALAWGFRWDGTATGEQMLDAIAAADPDLTVQITTYSFGDAVDALGFDGSAYGSNGPGSHYENGFGVGSTGYWSYYLGSGTTQPTWEESGVGFSDRTLSNDSWDGWSWAANFVDTPPSNPIIPAPIPAPEPASIVILAGSALLIAKRRVS